jgi:hypothetical protein
MSGASTARAVAVRDQIAAVLREAGPVPLSTPDIASRSLPWIDVQVWLGTCRGSCRSYNGYPVVTCHLSSTGPYGVRHTVKMPASSSWVYSHLRRLVELGIVARVDFADLDVGMRIQLVLQEMQRANRRPAYWRYADDQSATTFNQILQALEDA